VDFTEPPKKPKILSLKYRFAAPWESEFIKHSAEKLPIVSRYMSSNSFVWATLWMLAIAPNIPSLDGSWERIRLYSMLLMLINLVYFLTSFIPQRFNAITYIIITGGSMIYAFFVTQLSFCFPTAFTVLFFFVLLFILLGNYLLITLPLTHAIVSGIGVSAIIISSGMITSVFPDLPRSGILSVTLIYIANAVGATGLYFIEFNARCGFVDTTMLAKERNYSQTLLLNILPEKIAQQLQRSPDAVAEDYDSVTIMFADLVGFSAFAAKHDAMTVRNLLHELFSEFDQIAKGLGVEKIKVIGDSYMSVTGMPHISTDHARRMVHFAQAAQQYALKYFAIHKYPLGLRVGIHTGPVAAGVIGKTKYSYDLWGATVNIASRLESICQPGQILISSATKISSGLEGSALTDNGTTELRGAGAIHSFYVSSALSIDELFSTKTLSKGIAS
jgi:class 3 adenylate cyclase